MALGEDDIQQQPTFSAVRSLTLPCRVSWYTHGTWAEVGRLSRAMTTLQIQTAAGKRVATAGHKGNRGKEKWQAHSTYNSLPHIYHAKKYCLQRA